MSANNDRVKKAETLLRGVRLGLINSSNKEHQVYGLVALDLKLVCAESVGTIGVDGVHLFYNTDFVLGLEPQKAKESLSKLEILKPMLSQEQYDAQLNRINVWYGVKDRKTFEFLFRHEVDHIILEHMANKGTRDPQLWNQACDHRINLDIIGSWYKNNSDVEKQLPILKGAYWDQKYKSKDWVSSKIYEDLVKNEQQNKQNGKGSLDSHIYQDGQSQGQSSADGVTRDILGLPSSFQNPVSGNGEQDQKVDAKVAAERIKNSFVEAAKQVGLGEGNSILEAIKLSKPLINWKKVLRKNLSGLNKIEHDPKRISRRVHGVTSVLHDSGLINSRDHLFTAGKKPEQIVKAFIFFDTSGSISNRERAVMLGETVSIMTQYKNYEILVGCWDTQLYQKSIKTYTKQNNKSVPDYQFYGNGGTNPNVILPYLEQHKLKKTDRIIIFTDSYFQLNKQEWKKYENQCIFVSTEKNMHHVYSGLNIKYIEYDKFL